MEAMEGLQSAPAPFTQQQLVKRQEAKPISWLDFQRRYLSREDGYKYEWVNGIVEKTSRSMDQLQLIPLFNLRLFFETLRFSQKLDGSLEPEIDAFFLKNVHRRPDISYYSRQQLVAISKGQLQIPLFVIEIISTNDQINRVHQKMQNYRDAGVQVVWQIFPNLLEVHVYQGPQLNEMRVCKAETLCSAAPVLPDFVLPARNVFAVPEAD